MRAGRRGEAERMKIYFAGAIRAGRDDVALYAAMIAWLRRSGDVLTGHVGDPALSEAGDDGPDDRAIHDRDMGWLTECDCVVAEVSLPSLGVGYELGRAVAMGKPVLCLCRAATGKVLSAMIAGSPGIRTARYADIGEARAVMDAFIAGIAKAGGMAPPPSGKDDPC
jgi:nucleoside 2-deoxyribosyltransferase